MCILQKTNWKISRQRILFVKGVFVKKIIILIVMCVVVIPVHSSAWVNCEGNVLNFQIGASGLLQVTSQKMWGDKKGRAICSVGEHWKGVHPEACKAWFQVVLSSMKKQSTVKIQYGDGYTCNEIPAWGNASAPNMIEMNQ